MKTQLGNTLKKLSGSFKSFDINKLTPEETKDFLCSCGSWVVPAVQIIKSKVDEVKIF